jgi:hypothetical protein
MGKARMITKIEIGRRDQQRVRHPTIQISIKRKSPIIK